MKEDEEKGDETNKGEGRRGGDEDEDEITN